MKSIRILITHDPRVHIFYILCLIWIFAFIQNPTWQFIIFPIFSITLFSVFDLTFHYLKAQKWYFPFSSLVSGLLIGLIIHPSSGVLAIIFACVIGFISKQFIKFKNRHIFNPAAVGIVVSSLILGFPVSWWAVAPGKIIIFITIISGLVLRKLKRMHMPIIFLIGYFIFLAISQGIKPAISLSFDGTVFFFAFIMLPEPMTSNMNGFWKYGFSSIVLSIIIINYILRINIGDPLLLALLTANLISRIRN